MSNQRLSEMGVSVTRRTFREKRCCPTKETRRCDENSNKSSPIPKNHNAVAPAFHARDEMWPEKCSGIQNSTQSGENANTRKSREDKYETQKQREENGEN